MAIENPKINKKTQHMPPKHNMGQSSMFKTGSTHTNTAKSTKAHQSNTHIKIVQNSKESSNQISMKENKPNRHQLSKKSLNTKNSLEQVDVISNHARRPQTNESGGNVRDRL